MSNLDDLFALINENNPDLPYPLSSSNVTVGSRTVITADEFGRNTSVVVTGIVPGNYNGSETFHYRRNGLSEGFPDGIHIRRASFPVGSNFTAIFPDILTDYGIDLTGEAKPARGGTSGTSIPVMADGEVFVKNLISEETAFKWIGNVDLTLYKGIILLDDVITQTELTMFDHPTNPAEGKYSADILSWGLDFTPVREYLAISDNRFVNFFQIKGAAMDMGIPGWLNGDVVDYATEDRADSNPLYDRVVIQENVVSVDITGTLYFHYNLN